MTTQSRRAENLDALLTNRNEINGRLFYALGTDRPDVLPKYASIVGVDQDAPMDAPHPVLLHEAYDRPVPSERPWMACFDLDTGKRL